MQDKFILVAPKDTPPGQPLVRLAPDIFRRVAELRQRTRLSLSNIVGQCIDYALEHLADLDEGSAAT